MLGLASKSKACACCDMLVLPLTPVVSYSGYHFVVAAFCGVYNEEFDGSGVGYSLFPLVFYSYWLLPPAQHYY